MGVLALIDQNGPPVAQGSLQGKAEGPPSFSLVGSELARGMLGGYSGAAVYTQVRQTQKPGQGRAGGQWEGGSAATSGLMHFYL